MPIHIGEVKEKGTFWTKEGGSQDLSRGGGSGRQERESTPLSRVGLRGGGGRGALIGGDRGLWQ